MISIEAINPKLMIKGSSIEGKGVFAKERIEDGEFVVLNISNYSQYIVMDSEELEEYKKSVDYWEAIETSEGKYKVSDGARAKNPVNYVNHSCEPNTKLEDDSLVALQTIDAGIEITVDYSKVLDEGLEMKCNCGSKKCRKVIKRGRHEI